MRTFAGVSVAMMAIAAADSIGGDDGLCDPAELFGTSIEYSAGNGPRSVAIGDLNGDGAGDLATANWRSGANGDISVLLNRGDGTFADAVNYAAGNSSRTVAIGDLDGDGAADLAVANESSNDVSVLLNHGDGTFADAVHYRAGAAPVFVAIGDLNGDGARDLAAASRISGDVNVLLNTGDGAFADAVAYESGDARSVAIADLDGDGDNDLAAVNYSDFNVGVLLNNGDGTFAPIVLYDAGTGPRTVVIGDLNGDGARDLAVSNLASADISVLLNNGDGTFNPAVEYDVRGEPHGLAAGDLDGDGDRDLVATNLFDPTVSVLLNNGDGTFADAIEFGANEGPFSVAIGDLNGDGANDLAVANEDSDDVSVLLNQCGGAEIADLIDVQMLDGFVVSGGVTQMRTSDNAYFEAEARVTGEAHQTHLLRARIGADADRTSASTLQVTFEGRISDIESQTTLSLRDWNTNQMVEVGQFSIHMQDETHVVDVANASRFVRSSDGRLELEVRQIVLLPFTLNGFHTLIDLIEIEVN